MPSESTRRPLRERLYEKAHPDGLLLRPDLGRCWAWTGWFDHKGYASINWIGASGKRSIRASRLSWEVHHGPVPADLCVCHKCDNPACTRPDHLFLDTIAGNTRDMIEKGRARAPEGRPGERNPNAKLTDAEADEVRRLYAGGGVSQSQLARRFGCSQSLVSLIVLRRQRLEHR